MTISPRSRRLGSLGEVSRPRLATPSISDNGRRTAEELAQIRSTLEVDHGPGLRLHCLYGVGGVGKTQIALHYGYEQARRGINVFWIHADKASKLLQDIDDITRRLDMRGLGPWPDVGQDQSTPQKLFRDFLSKTTSWLIIFDSVASVSDLKPYWPSSKHGRILLTSLNQSTAHANVAPWFRSTQVAPFSAEESVQFMQWLRSGQPEEHRAALETSEILGGLPLALCHLVGYLNDTGSSMQAFLSLPGIRQRSFGPLDEHDAEEANFDYDLRFTTAFDVPLEALSEQPEAAELLNLLALLNTDSVEESTVLRAGPPSPAARPGVLGSDAKYNKAIAFLKKRSLVDQDVPKKQLRVHRLVRWAVIRKWTSEDWQRNFDKAFTIIDFLFPKQVTGGSLTVDPALERCRRVAPHVQALALAYHQNADTLTGLMGFAALLANCGYYMYERGVSTAALEILESARQICRKEVGDRPDLTHALVLNNLSNILSMRGPEERKESLVLDRTVCEWREALLPPDNVELGNSLLNLAVAYSDCEQPAEAKTFFQKADKVFNSAPDPPAQELVGLLYSNLGRAHLRLGELEDAQHFLDKALDIQRRELGAHHYFTTSTLYQIGNLRIQQSRLAEADTLIQQTIDARKLCLDSTDPRMGVAYHKLAWIRYRQGRLESSLQELSQAVDIFSQNDENANCEPGMHVRSLFLLALVLRDLGRMTGQNQHVVKAREVADDALKRRQEKCNIDPAEPWESDADMDRLVEPDFR